MIGLLKVNWKVSIGWLTHSNLAPSFAAFKSVNIRFNLTWIMKFGFNYEDGSRHNHGLHNFSIQYFSVSDNSQFIWRRAMEFWFIRLLNGRGLSSSVIGGRSWSLHCKCFTFPLRRGSMCFGCSRCPSVRTKFKEDTWFLDDFLHNPDTYWLIFKTSH